MSKKKQLTGKATKLAKLQLTRALSQKMGDSEPEPWQPAAPPEAPSPTPSPQLPLSWEDLAQGAAGLLQAAYALVRGEMAELHALVHGLPAPEAWEPSLTPDLPAIKEALRLTKQELQEVSRLYSV